ncbi:MAG: ABC transporter ATP-binding protein [Bacilli bacterium]|nr:ABC transporter ATP-binding protein [Bacilli bacterium]
MKEESYGIKIENLSKKYEDFELKDVSFNAPCGSIVGLIGENGAGKSTTIKAILDLTEKESGVVEILGSATLDKETKEHIGVVFEGNNFPEELNAKELNNVLKNIYKYWNEEKFYGLLYDFKLPIQKKIKDYSRGMKMKLAILVALSHGTKLLILDEATNGLDPIIREEILDILLDFIQDETHTVLFSSHITSDLEKIADYIVFIKNETVFLNASKDELIYEYGILKCKKEDFDKIDKEDIITYIKRENIYEILIYDKKEKKNKYKDLNIDKVTLDDIMLMYIKGSDEK